MTIDRRHWTPAADAATYLLIDEATVRDWCRRVERGIPTKIRRAKRDDDGRWYVSILDIYNLGKRFGLLRLDSDLAIMQAPVDSP